MIVNRDIGCSGPLYSLDMTPGTVVIKLTSTAQVARTRLSKTFTRPDWPGLTTLMVDPAQDGDALTLEIVYAEDEKASISPCTLRLFHWTKPSPRRLTWRKLFSEASLPYFSESQLRFTIFFSWFPTFNTTIPQTNNHKQFEHSLIAWPRIP